MNRFLRLNNGDDMLERLYRFLVKRLLAKYDISLSSVQEISITDIVPRDPSRSSNGGDYYYGHTYYSLRDKPKIRFWTSAEFPYCPVFGAFRNCTPSQCPYADEFSNCLHPSLTVKWGSIYRDLKAGLKTGSWWFDREHKIIYIDLSDSDDC